MRCIAKFLHLQQPKLVGTLYKGDIGSQPEDCHEFVMKDEEHKKE